MNKLYIILFNLVGTALLLILIACSADDRRGSGSSDDACLSDDQCKGDRICLDGRCANPDEEFADAGNSSDDDDRDTDDRDTNTATGTTGSGTSKGAAAAAAVTTAFSDEICAEGNATGTRLSPQIVLLLDGSSSMQQDYGDTTRWSAMRDALLNSNNGVVKTMEELIEFALVIYAGEYTNNNNRDRRGEDGTGSCPIPGEVVPTALNNYEAIEAAFPTSSPGRYTPTGEALEAVCNALPGVSEDGTMPQYVVLASDGQPNSCNGGGGGDQGFSVDYQSVVDAANICCNNGVTVYVISLASSGPEYEAHMQEIADIGMCNSDGPAQLYSPQSPEQLSEDLSQLIGSAMNCDVLLNGNVAEGKECEGSEVMMLGESLQCNDPDGWILAEPNLIRLQGQACEDFKNNPNAEVTATFPCEVFVPGDDDPGDDDDDGSDDPGDDSDDPGGDDVGLELLI